MKTIHSQLQTPELKAFFSGHSTIPKNDLRNFYRTRVQNFTEQFFRRVLYALEKGQVFIPMGAGCMHSRSKNPAEKKNFPIAHQKNFPQRIKPFRRHFRTWTTYAGRQAFCMSS